jgi:hypothetical protein
MNRNPFPGTPEANDRYDAYTLYCHVTGKKMRIPMEDDAVWIPALPFPIEIVASYRRLIVAHIKCWEPRGCMAAFVPRVRRFEKLEQQRDRFVKACQSKRVDPVGALDRLHQWAWPNIPPRDREGLERMFR